MNYLLIDLETTGVPKRRSAHYSDNESYDSSRIIQIAEIPYGKLKGYEFIRKKNKFVVQTIDEEVQRIDRKINELKALEQKLNAKPNTILDQIIEIVKTMDLDQQTQLLVSVKAWMGK